MNENYSGPERRQCTRRLNDCGPDGGAFIITLCIFSIVAGAVGFVAGTWCGWCIR